MPNKLTFKDVAVGTGDTKKYEAKVKAERKIIERERILQAMHSCIYKHLVNWMKQPDDRLLSTITRDEMLCLSLDLMKIVRWFDDE